ncbi:MAG: leucyl/phenylalanyl-tRNA--protein transferase [Alphaproteobacteria bacterium]|nr:leucyl/phenylalanyl-tRNA--protein transferase [Alphaproteobacteria bacterium]
MFPPVERIRPGRDGLVALGGDLHPDTLLEAYRKGVFPWDGRDPIPWYSPDPRLILRPGAFHAGHTVRRLAARGRLAIAYDTAFVDVMVACATVPRPGQGGTWITTSLVEAYARLHRQGVAHSVEVRDGERLVGGLYGLSIGSAFFGESMFARVPDASKLALYDLSRRLHAAGGTVIDCQQDTPHLRSLGAHAVRRADYLAQLATAVDDPPIWAAAMAVSPA